MGKLILVDGNSIAYRAFFALPLLSNSSGIHTNAVYGFTTMLMKIIEDHQPSHFLVAFDAGKTTFRHKDYEEYKGGRAKTPPELSEQFPLLKELLQSFGIQQFELDGYEADDIIGTLSLKAEQEGLEVLVVSGDKDLLQLASDQVTVALTRKGISEVDLYDPKAIEEKYGLQPLQIIDMKGLMGDASDNIPGIPGVGEKTALKLLHQYGSVEEVLAHTAEIKGKLKEKIMAHESDALLSKKLATIYREVPVDMDWSTMAFTFPPVETAQIDQLKQTFRKLEFKSLLERLDLNIDGNEGSGEADEVMDNIQVEIVDVHNFKSLVDKLSEVIAIHIEVTGENPHQGDVIGITLFTDSVVYYVPYDLLVSETAQPLRDWLADDQKAISIYDKHKSEVALSWRGITLHGISFDVLLAAYLIDPTESSLTLSGLMMKHGLFRLQEDDEVFGKGAKFKIPELEQLSIHLARKAKAVAMLTPILEGELDKFGMKSLFHELELPLSDVLAGMELQGIRVDKSDLQQYGKELEAKINQLIAEIYQLAGNEFNINSTKQLGEILFDKLGLPVIKKTKTGYSTDAEVLEKLEPYHEIISLILHYRTLAKLQSTYVEGLLKEVRPETGKVHTYYRQTIAATGRLSSQFPNLQNIPIRLEEGRKIRKVFVPSESGWYILAADYSQIELRVLAHISQDERLIEAFRQNMDIHTKTAMDVFGVTAEQVDANMRRQAKAVNFGIVYGISDYGLSQNLNITRKEAAEFINQYFAVFKGVRKFMDDIVKQARQDGYVTTLLQRRRYLPEINASNFNLRSFAERTAMNSPIQGTAADIIKLAMVQISDWLKREGARSRMLLQVHDELVFEVPEDELEWMKSHVPKLMESAIELLVPLRADLSYGSNWYDAK